MTKNELRQFLMNGLLTLGDGFRDAESETDYWAVAHNVCAFAGDILSLDNAMDKLSEVCAERFSKCDHDTENA